MQSGPLGPRERETSSRRPLLERSPRHRPFESGGSAGMSSSACVWLHTNTTSWHSKQQNSWRWFLSLTHVHPACFLLVRHFCALINPPESAKLVTTPSEVSGCLCTLRFKGKILISFLLKWLSVSLCSFFVGSTKTCGIFPLYIHPLSVTQFPLLQLL